MSGAGARSGPRRPILVELVGPPGAGKSTIFEGLLSRDDRIERRPIPSRRSYLGPMGWDLLAVATTDLGRRMLRRLDRKGLTTLAYLRALPRLLERRPSEHVVVFDQGPIFLLTRLTALDGRMIAWRARMLATWNARLDVIVVLDAPDAVLIDRINTRSKEHRIKGSSLDSAAGFIALSRGVYAKAVDGLGAQSSGPTILRFDTSLRPAAEVVEEIVSAVACLRPGSGPRAGSSPP